MRNIVTRRDFLKVAGAGTLAVATAGLTGCSGGNGGGSNNGGNNNNNNNNGGNNNNDNNNNNNDNKQDPKPDDTTNSSKDVGNGKVYRMTDNIWDETKTALFDGEIAVGYAALGSTGPVTTSAKYGNYELLMASYGIQNSSSDKIVYMEKTMMNALNTLTEDASDETIINKLFVTTSQYFTAKAGSTSLKVAAYGATAPLSDLEDINLIDTIVDPGEIGMLYLFVLAPKGWTQVDVRYTPNFAGGKYANFALKRIDVTYSDIIGSQSVVDGVSKPIVV